MMEEKEIIEWVFRLLQVGRLVALTGTAWQKFTAIFRSSSSNNEELVAWLLSRSSILQERVRILLILYRCQDSAASVNELFPRSNDEDLTEFRENVLGELHVEGLVRFDADADYVELLNNGRKYLEENVLQPCKPQFHSLRHGSGST